MLGTIDAAGTSLQGEVCLLWSLHSSQEDKYIDV